MISPAHVLTMARYNSWQNANLFGAAETLSDAARRQERGAFFGSIFGTLNHILWGDRVWMARFLPGIDKPTVSQKDSPTLCPDWDSLKAERLAMDATMIDWAGAITPQALTGDLVWFSGSAGPEVSKPVWQLVTHLFNHQTHHRGQVHALLTQAGARPGDTDLFLMPE